MRPLNTLAARSPGPSTRLRLALLGACIAVATGCATTDPAIQSRRDLTQIEGRQYEVLAADMLEFMIDSSADIESASRRIARDTDDPRIERNALLWRLNAVPALRRACFQRDPLAATFDAWAFALQTQLFFESGAGRDLMGPHQEQAVDTARRMLTRLRGIYADATQSDVAADAFERDYIRPWAQANPIEDISFVRPSSLEQFTKYTLARGDTYQRVRNIEEQVAVLAQQVRIYLSGLQKQMRGEVQLIVTDTLAAMRMDDLVQAATEARDAANRAATVAEQIPDLIRAERAIVLKEGDRAQGGRSPAHARHGRPRQAAGGAGRGPRR